MGSIQKNLDLYNEPLSCNGDLSIQLFRDRFSEKNVQATIPKGNMGHDQYSVPDTVAVETTFVALL